MLSVQLKELGLEPIVHRPVEDGSDLPKRGRYGSIVIGGSKLDIFDKDLEEHGWMNRLLDMLREAHGEVPMLGLCFGHQAIGRAFGARLMRYGEGIGYEVGFSPVTLASGARYDPLLRRMPHTFDALFSHFSYIADVPHDGLALAYSANPLNPSIQAFRVGDATWGLQFHPEYPPEAVRDLVIARRERIEGFIDYPKVLERLEEGSRCDERLLGDFARFVKLSISPPLRDAMPMRAPPPLPIPLHGAGFQK